MINGAAIAVTAALSDRGGRHPPQADRDGRDLRLLRCTRLPCDRPEVLATLHPPYISSGHDEPVAIATGRSGRPVIAMQDVLHGGLTVVSCDDADCDRPRTARFGRRDDSTVQEDDRFDAVSTMTRRLHFLDPDAVEVAVPPDDRPIVTYRNMVTGAATLLRCRTPDCASADTTVLSPPGLAQHAPALTVGPDGLPLIAVHNLTNTSVPSSPAATPPAPTATGPASAPTEVSPAPGPRRRTRRPSAGAVGRRFRRPRYELHLTTCRRARCAGGTGR